MTKYFIYSVLQYKHSLALGEILNVGVLFYFPQENHFEFADGRGSRVKSVYPDFDSTIFSNYLKAIKEKLSNKIDLFRIAPSASDFNDFIKKNILAEDAAGLIFKEPVQVKNVFSSHTTAIEEYSKLLLPGINLIRPIIEKHTDHFILRQFNGYLKGSNIEDKLIKNSEIKAGKFQIKFDLAWEKGIKNFIKPIAFDFTEEEAINNKSFQTNGLLNALKDANLVNSKFNFLISRPQNLSLNSTFENALDHIDSVKVNKDLILEDNWKSFSEEIISSLS